MSDSGKSQVQVDMVVVGAGFAGLYMTFKAQEAGLSVACFEAGNGVGGTWYWNRYPGARVDIECVEYSYSFSKELEQEWQWSERYAAQPEIERYANHVAERFNLNEKIQFGTRVVSAIFDEATRRWLVTTDQGDVVSAQYCIMATGLISAPVEPRFDGLETFRGEQFMTSRWPQEAPEFSGKRVAVIGTGSSGIQVISEVAKEADQLYVLQRTPSYTIPLQNRPVNAEQVANIKTNYESLRQLQYDSFAGFTLVHSELAPLPSQSALEVSPEERRAEYENRWASGGLSPYYAYTDSLLDEKSNETLAEFAREKIRERVDDPDLAEKLCPDYQILTRRLSPETNYLEVFNQANVDLVDLNEQPIERFTASGIIVGGEELELDAVVFATGFDVMTGAMDRIDVRGRNDRTLKDRWSEGLTSYLGMMTHGFPNLFWVNGPHSPFYNPILLAEYQGDFICRLFDELRTHNADTIEPDADAELQYVQFTNDIGNMTLFPKSDNYYMGDNIEGKPRNVVFFFGGFPLYREQCEAGASGLGGFSFS
ncbi:flavin-containing monooxygenase [Luminiphilus sp. nBUS_16]|uniref:flavin-containing monooxygenase n=1 Tax=Luminiphilus sp. nBUS_16 TaxID=3395315 RepID=UPI003EC06DED